MGTQHQTSKMLLRALAFTLLVSLARGEELVEADHQAKAFSLFNVVTFKNLDCESTSTSSTNGKRNGTCYTSEECDEKGGVASGSCAMGFGTCCLFTFQTCGTDVKQNCSYVRNEGFPTLIGGASSTASTCNYKIEKCDPKVCTLRLDFESFTLLAGTDTLDGDGACQDTFDVTGVTAGFSQIPTICGANTGEHIYVEVGPGATDSATLAFSFIANTANRGFELKVTQYTCDSPVRPPEGCLQWHTGTTGTIRTFNFANDDEGHLANQQYSVCIRQEAGFCCNKYSVCTDANSFTLFINDPAAAVADSSCTNDFLLIEGASEICNSAATNSRFCGGAFASEPDQAENQVLCQCQTPFIVGVRTDGVLDAMAMANNDPDAANLSHGVCLNYRQVPC